MAQRRTARTFALVAAAGAWASLVDALCVLITIDPRTYRPERYYMRGPGPKWREKHFLDRASAGGA